MCIFLYSLPYRYSLFLCVFVDNNKRVFYNGGKGVKISVSTFPEGCVQLRLILIRTDFFCKNGGFMEIKRVNINSLQPGMLVAENVYNSVNQLILPRDAVVTDKSVARLRFHSILSIRVYEDSTIEDLLKDIPAPKRSYYDKLHDTEEFISFNKSFNSTADLFKDKISSINEEDLHVEASVMVSGIHSLLDSCRTGIQLFDLLHCMRTSDDILYTHSINVALISAIIGIWLGYKSEDIDLLIQCGIFHDVGKLLIPQNIMSKPAALTAEEYNLVKTHTMRGYNLLRNKDIDQKVKLSAMMHHERCDGSGYPLGIKGDQIDELSKIVAIADVYEAMTSPRIYRSAICPFDVIAMFEKDGLTLYDPKVLLVFLQNVTQSYLGNNVKLNDGTIGTIVYINKMAYSRPMIQAGEEYIDLSKNPDKYITAII